MMRKTILIPLLSLASKQCDKFLELWVETSSENNRAFCALTSGPLQAAVEDAKRALQLFPATNASSTISVATSYPALASSSGCALALTLGLLLSSTHPYQRYIIIGILEFPAQAELPVKIGNGNNLVDKLQAVANYLGYQAEPTLLIMPQYDFGDKTLGIYQALANNNVAVRSVATLQEAYSACSGHL